MKQLVLILVLYFCTNAYAQLAPDIEGIVMVGGTEPLARMVVTLDSQGLDGRRTQVADLKGHFLFRSLPSGEYTADSGQTGFQNLASNGACQTDGYFC